MLYLNKEKTIYEIKYILYLKQENLDMFSHIKYISIKRFNDYQTHFEFLFSNNIEVYFDYLHLDKDIPKFLVDYFMNYNNHLINFECDVKIRPEYIPLILKYKTLSLRKLFI